MLLHSARAAWSGSTVVAGVSLSSSHAHRHKYRRLLLLTNSSPVMTSSRALSLPDLQDPGVPMIGTSPTAQVPPEAARALVGGSPANAGGRRCPICGKPLRPRQRVCYGRCRAELSRRRQAEVRQARDQQIRACLLAALALMDKNEQP